ncbi:MAG: hypothetical protein HC831_22250 [Chloroflexia bacterium]|nr:hypothetical protein [Chloroflexia bacterium]
MNLLVFYQVVIVLAIISPFKLLSQGCSDAGFCTVQSVKPGATDSLYSKPNTFKAGLTYGIAQYQVSVFSPYAEYTRKLGAKFSVTTRLIFALRNGKLATTYGLADALVSANYIINKKLQMVAGAKLPVNSANKTKNGLSLPMTYQTSLGTADIILGMSYDLNLFVITTAWQQPVAQNKNTFLFNDYPLSVLNEGYLSTNQYERKGDVLLRLSHQTNFGSTKYSLISSILPIYHLGNDTYKNNSGERITIVGSEGLTLNLNLFFNYKLNENNLLEFTAGAPVIARKSRPDGLSQFSLGVEYVVRF